MCGYIIMKKKLPRDELKKLLHLQRHRGTDGYGCIHLTSGKTTKALKLNQFLAAYAATMPKEGSIIVHHRKASLGGVDAELVHPIRTSAKDSLRVFQNGTKKELVAVTGTKSDTEAILKLWPLMEGSGMEEDMLSGAGLVFLWKDGVLTGSHDGERTLWRCCSGVHEGLFCSEPLLAGVWRECPPLKGLPQFPLDVSKWGTFLPLEDEATFVVNTRYSDEDHKPSKKKVGGQFGGMSQAATEFDDRDYYGSAYVGSYATGFWKKEKPVIKKQPATKSLTVKPLVVPPLRKKHGSKTGGGLSSTDKAHQNAKLTLSVTWMEVDDAIILACGGNTNTATKTVSAYTGAMNNRVLDAAYDALVEGYTGTLVWSAAHGALLDTHLCRTEGNWSIPEALAALAQRKATDRFIVTNKSKPLSKPNNKPAIVTTGTDSVTDNTALQTLIRVAASLKLSGTQAPSVRAKIAESIARSTDPALKAITNRTEALNRIMRAAHDIAISTTVESQSAA